MVKIPFIKIPSVRVGSIVPTSNMGTGGATPAPPTPITYLTQWKIVGNSEVHTLPYPDGVVLPNGYKRCEYLSFANAQYFDSGILTSNDIGIRIKFRTSSLRNTIIGARKSSSSSAYLFGYFDDNGTTVYVGYGGSSKSVSLAKSYTDGNTHTLIFDSTQVKIDNEDISFTRGIGTEFFNILIGAWNNNGAVDSVNAKYTGKIEEVEIYNSSQTLGNFIPCLDDNNVPCLYDTISETTLYNQGAGTCGYEIELQPTEIWSCGEYNATDGKYHILVQPLGGSIADIALDEPLRKVGDVADSIEFPVALEAFCNTDGSQIQTTLPDDTILHIQNLVTGINNISTSYLTVTKNNNGSATLVGNNNTGDYIFHHIGTIISTPTLNNTYFMTGMTGGSMTKYDIRYGGNMPCYDDDNLLKATGTSGQSNGVAVMLRDGNNIDATLFFLMLCIDDMFADATDFTPTTASDFRAMFPNLIHIENTSNIIDIIVKDGKLYKYVETEGKALVITRVEESGGELSPLDTPTTELVDAPQIAEAESYTCVINQGGKAVSWSSFETNSE